MELLGLSVPAALFAAGVVVFAAFVRGFAGFGSSMLWVSGLSLVLPPAQVVPAVLLLEVAASLGLLPAVWRQVHWRSLRWIAVGTVAATPFGVRALAGLPPDAIRLAIAAVVCLATLLLWRGWRLETVPGAGPALATGLGAGLLNGGTGIGGPPVILFYVGSAAGAAMSRATLIAYFLLSDTVGTLFMAEQGLVTGAVLARTALALPLAALGLWAGQRHFRRSDPARFRRLVLLLLVLLSAGLALQAVADL